uniref:Lipase domain-containing protein n=1 Tax=Timema tahoe TaxID=61484 RepID=A0A7R9NZ50_9NEOP|nr:unnamed protein product [Timema tahoe]
MTSLRSLNNQPDIREVWQHRLRFTFVSNVVLVAGRNAVTYSDKEQCNVVCVDWSAGAAVPNYVRAAANARLVGRQVSMLLAGLGTPLENVHIIGFSLGAHVAGFAGAQLKNVSRITVTCIKAPTSNMLYLEHTGLDPAGPLFESQDPRARLDSSDAMFVDVIHSNGENLILGGLGSWQPMGHVDFYPNGGRMQKGCSNLFVGAVSDIIWSASDVEGRSLCNHRRAYKFFTDSVSPRCHFPSFPCNSYDSFLEGTCFPCSQDRHCGNMGYYADRSHGRGTLYLVTRDEEPFCGECQGPPDMTSAPTYCVRETGFETSSCTLRVVLPESVSILSLYMKMRILTTPDVACSVFTAHQYHVRLEHSPRDEPLTSYGKIQLTLIGTNNINETFTLTQKDDEEIKSGGSLTRMLVPHPILQDPSSVEVTYTAYSGWISSGLPSWDVNKVTLTDSVGQSLSVCKKGLTLTSGVSVILPLYPGECNPPRTSGPVEDDWSTNQTTTTTTGGPREQTNVTRFKPTPIIRVGDEGLNRTEDLSGDVLEHPSWHPLDTNSLEDSRAFNSDIFTVVLGEDNLTADGGPHPLVDRSSGVSVDEIKEPVLRQVVWVPAGKTPSSSIRRNGSRSEDPPRPEITEPVLNPKTLFSASITSTLKPSVVRTRHISDLSPPPEDAWSSWRSDSMAEEPRLGPMQTVQLFPQRLASILAQAERYARTTLVQTPTGNSQNNTSTDGSSAQTQRRAKLMTTDGPDDVTVSPIIDARGVGIVRTSQGSQVLVPYSYSSADSSSNQNARFIPLSYIKDSSAPLSARQSYESTEGASKDKNEDSRFGGYFNIFYQLFSKIPPR